MTTKQGKIIAVANQKGGVGKTTTAVNLAQALALAEKTICLIDLDPQGNATQGSGVKLETIHSSIANILRDRSFPIQGAVYHGSTLDLIPATPVLSQVEREMIGMTNSELRLGQRLKVLRPLYDFILIDTPPTFGPLMNSALNAADEVLVPVDSGYFALLGIKELLNEMNEIRSGTNPNLKILGYLLTMTDNTKISQEVLDGLIQSFGDEVFECKVRRSVKLKEAPALGQSIFHHAPESSGAQDYMRLAEEFLLRMAYQDSQCSVQSSEHSHLALVQGGSHD